MQLSLLWHSSALGWPLAGSFEDESGYSQGHAQAFAQPRVHQSEAFQVASTHDGCARCDTLRLISCVGKTVTGLALRVAHGVLSGKMALTEQPQEADR